MIKNTKTSRGILIKAEEETNPKYGYIPNERPIELHMKMGIINLDKPPGPTSHEVVSWIKRILKVRKAGHAGTLEPWKGGEIPK